MQGGGALVGFEFVEDGLVIPGLDHDRDVVVVLGRGADHRRAADIDILDAVGETSAFVDGGLERIEVDHQEVDRRDAVGRHRLRVLGIVPDREQPAMHLRVQRLDPAVHHFRKSGQLRDVPHLQPGLRDRLCRATGRDQLDAMGGQRPGKLDQAGLVGNGEKRAGDAAERVGHGRNPGCRAAR